MKRPHRISIVKNLFPRLGVALRSRVLPALIAVLNLLSAGRVTTQTFTTLHSFTATSTNSSGIYTNGDGAGPGGLILSGSTLYGTANGGGLGGNGTVFSISFTPQLTIIPSGTNVILSWPVSIAGFSSAGYMLQDTADLSSPTGWSVPDPFPPVIVNGQFQVTRSMLGPQRSYRLTK